MGKTSSASKNKWNAKAYDTLRVFVPKGRKKDVEARATERGKSVNGHVNDLIRQDIGMDEAQWKAGESIE